MHAGDGRHVIPYLALKKSQHFNSHFWKKRTAYESHVMELRGRKLLVAFAQYLSFQENNYLIIHPLSLTLHKFNAMTTHDNYAESENTYNILDTIYPYFLKEWKSTCGYNQLSSLYTFVCLINDFKINWHFHFLCNPQWLQKSMSEILNLLSSLDMVFTLFMLMDSGLNWVLALDDLCRGLLLLCTVSDDSFVFSLQP